MNGKGPYPFAEKVVHYRTFSVAGLVYSIKDAREARDVCGAHDPSAWSYYQDDVLTLADELERRRKNPG